MNELSKPLRRHYWTKPLLPVWHPNERPRSGDVGLFWQGAGTDVAAEPLMRMKGSPRLILGCAAADGSSVRSMHHGGTLPLALHSLGLVGGARRSQRQLGGRHSKCADRTRLAHFDRPADWRGDDFVSATRAAVSVTAAQLQALDSVSTISAVAPAVARH